MLKQFKPRYRPHIDGLRTIAVLSVLLYHLGASYLPGGFTGVDIFFVISGFLISRIIYSESLEGSFSVTRFYERRAKRILPAFAVVTALTTIGVYFLFLPSEFLDFSESVLAAVFFSANVYFYMTADYFAPAAHSLPALHYWSLGVEEQFYVFFPLIVFAIVRFRRNYLPIAIGALLIASLMASEVIVRTNPPAAFYLLPYRASELLIGCIIALPEMRFASSTRVGAAASWAGITLLASGLLFLQPDMRFPGINALPPTVGTALVLWGNDRNPNIISRVLGTLPMTWMGKLSYSLYLIHWPLILFAERLFPYAAPGVRAGGVFVLSVILASLSYRFVEQPFRRLSFWTPSRIFAAAGASLTMLVLSSAIVMYYRGFPGRLDSTVAEILAFERYDLKPQFRSRICFLDPDQAGSDIDVERCLPKTSLKKAVLWGDSAAAHLYFGLRESLEQAGYSLGQLTASGCPPAVGLKVAPRPNCVTFSDIALARILEERPDLLILASAWNVSDALLDKLDETILKLRAAGITPVVLGAPPFYRASVPRLVADRLKAGNRDPSSGPDLAPGFNLEVDAAIEKHLQSRSDVRFVSIIKTACPGNQCPMVINSKIPVHFDQMHLTPAGSKLFANALLPQILPNITASSSDPRP